MATTARGVSLLPTRIPQRAPLASVNKVTTKLAALNLNGTNNGPTIKKNTTPLPPQKITSPVRKVNKEIINGEKKVQPPKTNRPSSPVKARTEKPANSIVKTSTVVKKDTKVNAATLDQSVKKEIPPGMSECKICGRHFASDRVQKHQEICAKSTKKKRKVFDPVKHRLKGTEAECMITHIKKAIKKPEKPKPTNWRKKHEDFIESIRAARKVQEHLAKGGKLTDLPPPPPLDTSDYVSCPHCGRKFNEAAAERHIKVCANMQHNKPKPGMAKNDKQIKNKMLLTKRK